MAASHAGKHWLGLRIQKQTSTGWKYLWKDGIESTFSIKIPDREDLRRLEGRP